MTEIVINRCPRGTLLSEAGEAEYLKRKGVTGGTLDMSKLDRADTVLVALLKEDIGKRVWGGKCSDNEFVTVPDGFKWKLMTDGGGEWIAADVS